MRPLVDLSLEELLEYKPPLTKQPDFDEFWERTLQESKAQPLNAEIKPYDYAISQVKVYDVTYDGFKMGRIGGWYIIPAWADEEHKVPALVHYHGYSGNRGYINEFMKWVIMGYAVFSIDVRGQGGCTPEGPIGYDAGGISGWMTKGINDKEQYYYCYVYMDCVRAVDFICSRPEIDTSRIGVFGGSQGGGLTIAVAGLDGRPVMAMADYPYLCHFRRALEMYQEGPYDEIYRYFRQFDPSFKTIDKIFETLSYFDGMNLGTRIKCPILVSVGLRDVVCPPSTIFAAYNHMNCPKQLRIYPNHGHEGMPFHEEERIAFAKSILG